MLKLKTPQQPLHEKNTGFTIIEILIVLCLIGLISGIGYPSYIHHTQKTHCQQATIALHQISSRLDHIASLQGNYDNILASDLSIQQLENQTPYHYSFKILPNNQYQITAIATGQQQHASASCRKLNLNHNNSIHH